jgi:hypothetical protein
MVDQFTVDEQRAIARIVSELVQPLGLKIMVLGRVALFYRYGLGGSSKEVDLHPYPLVDTDLLEVNDELAGALSSRGGHLEWMPDGRGLIVYIQFEERTAPVALIFGGEDWIDEHVLEDAIRTGEEMDGVLVPTDEHLFVMKAEAYVDRRDQTVADKYLTDMIQIVEALEKGGSRLDPDEVTRLVMMRPVRKHEKMRRVCISVMPVEH